MSELHTARSVISGVILGVVIAAVVTCERTDGLNAGQCMVEELDTRTGHSTIRVGTVRYAADESKATGPGGFRKWCEIELTNGNVLN